MWRFVLKAFIKRKSDLLQTDKTEKAIVEKFRRVDLSQVCLKIRRMGKVGKDQNLKRT